MTGEFIDDLRREIASGRAMLVIGSGVSIGATNNAQAARWAGLIQLGVDRCCTLGQIDELRSKELSARLSGGAPVEDLLNVAESVTQKLRAARKGEYSRWLGETVGSLKAVNTAVLREIDRLDLDIATTNYDSLLETHTRRSRHVTWPRIGDVLRILRKQDSSVLHLHGHWEDEDSVVLGVRSYEDLLRNKAAEAVSKSLPMLRTLVFIGCGEGLNDPNFKKLIDWYQDVLQMAEHRHYRLVTHRDMAKGRVSQGVFDLPFGTDYDDLPAFLSSLRAPRLVAIDDRTKSRMTIHLDQWADFLLTSPATNKIAEGDMVAARAEPVFRAIVAATEEHEKGAHVQAVSMRLGFKTKPSDFRDLLLDTMAVLVLDPANAGHLKGAIKRAVATIGREKKEASFLHQVLDKIVRRYLVAQSDLCDEKVARQLIERAIETFDCRDADSLFRFGHYLAFFEPAIDAGCLTAIQKALIRHSAEVSANPATARAYMSAVKTLIGRVAWEARRRDGSAPLSIPSSVPVTNSLAFKYSIDALRTPITNMQWHEVTGRHFDESIRKPSHPFVFEMISSTGAQLYGSLASELEVLVAALRHAEPDKDFEWDVPTAPEWLALAGCEVNPYPWGSEPPSADHANLRFDARVSTLQPVDLYPKGNSPCGAADCCGNVHEIVRIEFSETVVPETFARAFRLAGGCFQNPPAACTVLRPFKLQARSEETRRNVGVRLVRYRKSDRALRSSALAAYLDRRRAELSDKRP